MIVEAGGIRQGVIIRHLVLPGLPDQSREVLDWFDRHAKGRALLSLMFQYTPVASAREQAVGHPRRSVNRREYEQVLSRLDELGIDDGYVQDPAVSGDWLPDFTRPNPFPQDQAVPVWHYQNGTTA